MIFNRNVETVLATGCPELNVCSVIKTHQTATFFVASRGILITSHFHMQHGILTLLLLLPIVAQPYTRSCHFHQLHFDKMFAILNMVLISYPNGLLSHGLMAAGQLDFAVSFWSSL